MTKTEESRALIERVFAELARDNPKPFVEALAPDVRWTTPGKSVWSRSFSGKQSLLTDLIGPVRDQLVERVRLQASRVIADGEVVVVEAKGRATTKRGKPYDNEYCFVYRVVDGKIAEVTEYLDTELASAVLQAPWDVKERAAP